VTKPDPRGKIVTARSIVVAVTWLAAVAGAFLVFGVRPAAFSGSGNTLGFAGLALMIVTNASVGAILMLKRPGNVVGVVLMLTADLTAVTLLGWVSGVALTEQRGPHDTLAGLMSVIGAVGFLPSLIVAGPLLALLFPTGRLPSPRWRLPLAGIAAAGVIGSTIVLARPGPIVGTAADSPFGASGFSGSEAFWPIGEALGIAALVVALLLGVTAVAMRFRRSRGVERAQLKWFVAANVAVGTFVILGLADGGFLGLVAGTNPTILDLLADASSMLPPVAVGIAILRYRLFEIDHLIARTLSWAVVTGLLVGGFAAAVVALEAVLADFTQGQTVAVAASTLVAFALFQPLRRRVQSAVDRRFDRAHYDAQRTVAEFSDRLRDEVDLASVSGDIVGVVDTALHPSTIGVWIRRPVSTNP
jgi:hypothetical protein